VPADDGYDAASTAFVRKGAPALVVQPATADDVAAAVLFAAEHQLVLSVKSGGHSGSGFSTNSGGLVIDLARLNTVEVLEGTTVRLGAGATWGRVAAELGPHGLGISSGDVSNVGVGGLTLGGGFGWLVRECGLTLDTVRSAQVVTAAGEIVTASQEHDAELFWAIRGGGGNFGVVVSFVIDAHPLTAVRFGAIEYGLDDLGGLLKRWRDVMRDAPRQLTTILFATPETAEAPAQARVLVCHCGPDADAASADIAPLLELGPMRRSTIGTMPYADALVELGPQGVDERTIVENNAFIADFDDEAIDALAHAYAVLGPSAVKIRSICGAVNDVPADATAFAYRDSEVLFSWNAYLPPAAPAAEIQRVRDIWAPLSPFTQGIYGNFSSAGPLEVTSLMYPSPTLDRLRAVKRDVDPANLFDQNHNITP
jgi:FAD/FMN-containing dehydrogenase